MYPPHRGPPPAASKLISPARIFVWCKGIAKRQAEGEVGVMEAARFALAIALLRRSSREAAAGAALSPPPSRQLPVLRRPPPLQKPPSNVCLDVTLACRLRWVLFSPPSGPLHPSSHVLLRELAAEVVRGGLTTRAGSGGPANAAWLTELLGGLLTARHLSARTLFFLFHLCSSAAAEGSPPCVRLLVYVLACVRAAAARHELHPRQDLHRALVLPNSLDGSCSIEEAGSALHSSETVAARLAIAAHAVSLLRECDDRGPQLSGEAERALREPMWPQLSGRDVDGVPFLELCRTLCLMEERS
jgi:hypothetical protein